MSRAPLAVSVRGAAELLGVSRSMVYSLMQRADFPPGFKVGARTLFTADSLRDWVRRQEAKASDR